MKRILALLVPWMVLGTAVGADVPRPATVSFTHFGIARDLIWRVGDECYISPPIALRWGWNTSISGDEATLTVDGRRVKIALARVDKTLVLPLRAILQRLDAGSGWRPGTDVLDVWGTIKRATIQDGRFTMDATLGTRARITQASDPPRVVVDLPGLRLDAATRIELGPRAKVLQQPDGVRMILQTDEIPPTVGQAQLSLRSLEYDLKTGFSGALSTIEQLEDVSGAASDPTVHTPTTGNSAPGPQAGALTLVSESATGALLGMALPPTVAATPSISRPSPTEIAITFPSGTRFDTTAPQTKSIVGLDSQDDGKESVLTLKLARAMGAEIAFVKGSLQLQLWKPAVGDARLAGKIVVVDPGHGGSDTGARSPAKDLAEKDLTLAISKLLATALASQGATVVMTRKTDVAVPLYDRPAMAARNKADLFLSVHINSNKTGLTTGGMTFYHMKDPLSSLLAQCVQDEIAKVSGLPNFGIRSDRTLYTTGLAVLRSAKMPAVLIELGFINHPTDRARMLKPEFQEAVASAIVEGLKVYLGDAKEE